MTESDLKQSLALDDSEYVTVRMTEVWEGSVHNTGGWTSGFSLTLEKQEQSSESFQSTHLSMFTTNDKQGGDPQAIQISYNIYVSPHVIHKLYATGCFLTAV